MANKRMFSMDIVDSDAFLDLPLSAQALYFQLGMRADDDGAIGNVKAIRRYIGASEKDLTALMEHRFLLLIDNIVFIKHWKINNYIVPNRHHDTAYREQFLKLKVKDNKSYTELYKRNTPCNTKGTTDVVKEDIQDALLEENRVEETRKEEKSNTLGDSDEPPTVKKTMLDGFFDSIWKLYPRKEGKGSVSKTQKQKLQKIGYEQMERCIVRYKAKLKNDGTEEKYIKQGSTFFNSGYVDYLDENYEPNKPEVAEENKPVEKLEKDKFSNMDSRKREELEFLGIIDGQGINCGEATEDQIKYLQDGGWL